MSTPVTSRGARVPLRMQRDEEGATATSPLPSFINPPTAQSVMTKRYYFIKFVPCVMHYLLLT